jgi:hypothetical protein
VPEIDRVRTTRVHVAAGGDFYLCPLPVKQLPTAELAALVEPVRLGQQATTSVWRRKEASGKVALARQWTMIANTAHGFAAADFATAGFFG